MPFDLRVFSGRVFLGNLARMGDREPQKMIPVKGPASLQKRLKLASVEEGVTYAELITRFLDDRDARVARERESQASPLHRPRRMPAVAGYTD